MSGARVSCLSLGRRGEVGSAGTAQHPSAQNIISFMHDFSGGGDYYGWSSVESVQTIPDPDWAQLRFVIARARERQQLTQEELSQRSGVSRQSILDIGSGKSRGSIETWLRLARALNITVDELTAPVWDGGTPDAQGDPTS